jgi:bis(5'-adenosyl)-triphosphatase
VPHTHVHVIPRKKWDYQENDTIYDDLEGLERSLGCELRGSFPKIKDKDRIPRTEDDMATEAAWLATFFNDN